MEDCLFCKIVEKELPSYIIYENDKILAFLDIKPITNGHTLVIPKKHSTDMTEMSDEEASELINKAKELIPKIVKAVGAKGANFATNCKSESGQDVFHTHFHIIPRWDQKELPPWPHSNPSKEELAEVKNNIVSFLKE
ncbi:HIT family protein [Candidatus Woesearchaeota archaeon]|nr:HIT family protein [Candidatus Woesearchaeota archaeon]